MPKIYRGLGYLTGGNLSFTPGHPKVRVDDDSKTIHSEKDGHSSMTNIGDVHARQVLDSRGNPTVEAEVTLMDGTIGRASCPAEPPPESMKRSSCVTATPLSFSAKVCLKR